MPVTASSGRDLGGRLADRCRGDAEFRLCARYWTGSLRFELEDDRVQLQLVDGEVVAGVAPAATEQLTEGPGHIGLRAPADLWAKILAAVPSPFHNDVVPAQALGLQVEGEAETFWQYYPAVRRAVELLRQEWKAEG